MKDVQEMNHFNVESNKVLFISVTTYRNISLVHRQDKLITVKVDFDLQTFQDR